MVRRTLWAVTAILCVLFTARASFAFTRYASLMVRDTRMFDSVNSEGGTNSVVYDANALVYKVTLSSMIPPANNAPSNVQIHPMNAAFPQPFFVCSIRGGNVVFTDYVLTIVCFDRHIGFPVPGPVEFFLQYRSDDSPLSGPDTGYARMDLDRIIQSWNSSGGTVSFTHPSAGRYSILFSGLLDRSTGGNVQVTATTTGHVCDIVSWFTLFSGTTVNVACFDYSNPAQLADTAFHVFYGQAGFLNVTDWAYAWNSLALSVSAYTPNTFYQRVSSGGQITIRSGAEGTYYVTIPNFPAQNVNVQVTSYDTTGGVCGGSFLDMVGQDARVFVSCSRNNLPFNTRFSLMVSSPH